MLLSPTETIISLDPMIPGMLSRLIRVINLYMLDGWWLSTCLFDDGTLLNHNSHAHLFNHNSHTHLKSLQQMKMTNFKRVSIRILNKNRQSMKLIIAEFTGSQIKVPVISKWKERKRKVVIHLLLQSLYVLFVMYDYFW